MTSYIEAPAHLRVSAIGTVSEPSELSETASHTDGHPTANLPGRPREPVWGPESLGARLGRDVLLAACDTELDRKVALNLLEARQVRAGRERVPREAQALAQLQHPNVVAVFEIGEIEGHVYLAMEYVEGLIFDRWVQARVRPWREILDVAVRAGRGLAAGIVHRDFKPSNVRVGADGRVRVVDFGIAVAAGTESVEIAARLSLDAPHGDRVDGRGDASRRRARVVGTLGVLGAVALAGVFAVAPGDGLRCEDARIGTWDDARRAEVRAAFTTTGLTYVGESFHRAQRPGGGRRQA